MSSPRDIETDLHLLNPLDQLFGSISSEKRRHYHESLKKFTNTELQGGFIFLRDNYSGTKFPSIADISRAIKCGARSSSSHPGSKNETPWQIRNNDRDKLVSDYMKQYENDRLARQGEAAGWGMALKQYVSHVAQIQAEYILKFPHIGWSSGTLFGYSAQSDIAHKLNYLLGECRTQAQTGRIDVIVPAERIEEWERSIKHKTPVSISYEHPIETQTHIKKQLEVAAEKISGALIADSDDKSHYASGSYDERKLRNRSGIDLGESF